MNLSPLAERLLRHRRATTAGVAMEAGDQAEIIAAIGDAPIFAKKSDSVQRAIVAGAFKIALNRANDELAERHLDHDHRIRNRDGLLSHLKPILKILDDDVGGLDAADMLLEGHRGELFEAMREATELRQSVQRLLNGARDFTPWPSREGRGEEPFDSERNRQALLELIELLGSVGVHVRASLGRKTKLFAALYGYVTGEPLAVGTVRNLLLKNRYKPD